MISLDAKIAALNDRLTEYQRFTRLSLPEAMAKHAANLATYLRARLRQLTPPKGSIRSERLDALAHGGGIYVRPSVRESVLKKRHAAVDVGSRKTVMIRGKKQAAVGSLVRKGKRLNLQALMVERELNLRESGRGYTPYAAQIRRLDTLPSRRTVRHVGRYLQELADVGMKVSGTGTSVTFEWGGQPGVDIGESLEKPRAQEALSAAVDDTIANLQIYLSRKLAEAAP